MSKREAPHTLEPPLAPRTAGSLLQLIVLSPGEQPNVLQETPPFKLCHGARHRLEVMTPDGSTWLGQPLSLHWMSSEGTPNRYGLTAAPQLVTDSADQADAYQNLPAEGVEWQLTAAADSVASGDVRLGLGSWWQAPKYPFDAQVSDHWYSVSDLAWDGTVPIVEGGKPTTLTATVSSAFDDKRLVEGAMVEWTVGAQSPQIIPTDANGQSEFEYTPKAEDIVGGYITVKATCIDALAHETNKERALRAFDRAPWLDQLKMVLREKDGPVVEPTPLGMRLVRGGEYQMTLTPDGDYFLGDLITLDWFEGSKSLGIEFSPKGEQKLAPEGLSWSITGGNESGLFNLYLWSKTLGQDVPFLLPGVQMSADLVDEASLEIVDQNGNPQDGDVLVLWRREPMTIKLIPKEGSWLGSTQLKGWITFDSEKMKPEELPAQPGYGVEEEMAEEGLSWTLTGGNFSGKLSLMVHVKGFSNPLELKQVILLSRYLEDEADLEVETTVEGLPPIFLRGKGKIVQLVLKEGSPLGLAGLAAELRFKQIEDQLAKENLPAKPDYESPHEIIDGRAGWTLEGKIVSGVFGLEFHVAEFRSSLSLDEGMLLSEKLSDELQITIDEVEFEVFSIYEVHEVLARPRPGSPIYGNKFSIDFIEGAVSRDDVHSGFAFGGSQRMYSDGISWKVWGVRSDKFGSFGLAFTVEGIPEPLTVEGLLLPSNLRTQFERNYWHRQDYFFFGGKHCASIKPKSDSVVLGRSDDWWFEFDSDELEPEDVETTPGYGDTQAMSDTGREWAISIGSKKGAGRLHIVSDIYRKGQESWPFIVLSPDFKDEVEMLVDGVPEGGRPIVFRGAQTKKITFKLKPGSPVDKSPPVRVIMYLEPKDGVTEDMFVSDPPFDEMVVVNKVSELGWSVSSVRPGAGKFTLRFIVDGVESSMGFSDFELDYPS
ncbi:Ig-like domain-containing protein [Pseudomonas entomophila]|uniref:Ig-like domain-containing protein n=1 Tax=Pseudomonas entomophila TaxID=312306 RepID=UPI001F02A37A|nr:Ig-like domain-containing protein [Pseudomonas entomophila]MCG8294784.1 Ig-like domain-containing protein [Pseudomonas entomophila]